MSLEPVPAAPTGPAVVRPGSWNPLGVNPSDDGVDVALWAAGATQVWFCVFDERGVETRILLPENTFEVFHGFVPGIAAGTRYGFRVDGPWDPGRGLRFNPAKLLLDPYARAIDGSFRLDDTVFGHRRTESDLVRSDRDSAASMPRCVVQQDDFDWGEDAPPSHAWADTIVYEAHVKGLTMRHPGVPEAIRGTYAGLAHESVIDHLLALGVTAVELLPVHHFLDEEHLVHAGLTNYWGYNSIGFFAPHAAYSSSGTRGEQVTEFKAMVKSLHDAGLEVILDVVYNHTAEAGEQGPTLSFRGISNPHYYKLGDGGRTNADYTGTGNTVDASDPHVVGLILDSLRYWVQEMHVDGFRFDLASALARVTSRNNDVDMNGAFLTAIGQDPVLRRVKLIAEPWDVGGGGYQVGAYPPPWTEWNDRYRDTVRDFWRGMESGVGELGWRLSGSADLFASDGRRPSVSVNFVTAHDGFPMRDLVTYNGKHNEANGEDNRDGTDNNRSWNHGVEGETDDVRIRKVRRRQIRNMMATLAMSTGVPMIVAGDEMGRTQGGNNNAYCQDNEISWVNWDLDDEWSDLLAFTRRVIGLRRDHRVFRQSKFFTGTPVFPGGPKDLAWLSAEGGELSDADWHSAGTRTVGLFLSGHQRERTLAGGPVDDDSMVMVLHAGDTDTRFTLPGAPFGASYLRILDTSDERPKSSTRRDRAGSSVLIRARSMAVFCVAVPAAPTPA